MVLVSHNLLPDWVRLLPFPVQIVSTEKIDSLHLKLYQQIGFPKRVEV